MKLSLFVASSLILGLAACGQPQETPTRPGEMMAGADEMPMAGEGGVSPTTTRLHQARLGQGG